MFYLLSIAQPPTKISTVEEVLYQVNQKAEVLKNKKADLVLDHAIYCKALEVIMDPRNIGLCNFVNLRMGTFHVSCIFIAVTGKRFGAAGLKVVCIEASLIGISSVDRVLKGKQYNKGVRALKIIYKALQRLKFETFERWLRKENKEGILVDYLESTELLQLINNTKKQVLVLRLIRVNVLLSSFYILTSPMAVFWNSFIEMTQILLDYIKSSRTGDLSLHLQASERMLVWFFEYDRINYSRHFSYNWATQQKLHLTHPAIYHEFIKGYLSVKRARGNFNKLLHDQVIEQTINIEQKGSGGIIGISTLVGAVQRWILSSHIIAGLMTNLKESVSLATRKKFPKN